MQKFVAYLTEAAEIKVKDWVMIKKGAYAGKTGYVSAVNDSLKRCTIELSDSGRFIQDSEPLVNVKKIKKPKFD